MVFIKEIPISVSVFSCIVLHLSSIRFPTFAIVSNNSHLVFSRFFFGLCVCISLRMCVFECFYIYIYYITPCSSPTNQPLRI